ncbi:UvrB/UvrC motif-containing protein [Alkalihalobacterium chitinilyticum]|uniref:UvrB/UvrC motif-containing protein n=1 Tax=Alkalihalobacterium chitinilyticum TaxID=2980103 RepID=A0ABT5VJV2_9BACI|nr:UvrB/UvrC motif-containing protein [Alkalihalobacterium chitinilyticum]MDE5415728.1 UvrB/UvrC motif-containing protein [Alkalihalobacterium chitinilyticum]
MICQECNKRPATLHFTKIINGEKTEFHICEHCAKEKGEYFPGSNSFSIHQLLSGLLNFEQPVSKGQTSGINPRQPLTCKKCEMSYEQFVRTGRFGCATCYQTFSDKLDPILKKVHSGNHSHSGKIPKRIGGTIEVRRKINTLKEALQQHIAKEEFEEAATVRDHIRSLEKSIFNQGEA